MKQLLPLLSMVVWPQCTLAQATEQLTMTMWHLTAATDVATTYGATCAHGTYTLTAARSLQALRATAVTLTVQDGATRRTADLTNTALGLLLTEPTGFGELGFACRPQRLFVFYRGATQAHKEASLVAQSAVFALSPEGELSVPPPEGITVTPLR